MWGAITRRPSNLRDIVVNLIRTAICSNRTNKLKRPKLADSLGHAPDGKPVHIRQRGFSSSDRRRLQTLGGKFLLKKGERLWGESTISYQSCPGGSLSWRTAIKFRITPVHTIKASLSWNSESPPDTCPSRAINRFARYLLRHQVLVRLDENRHEKRDVAPRSEQHCRNSPHLQSPHMFR